jgi:phosphatidyl-myo-inositol dimannoside synthase
MKVVVLTLDFPPSMGGVQRYLFEIVRRFDQRHEVTVLTATPGELPPDQSFQRRVLPAHRPFAWVSALRAERPDRVLVGHAHPRLLVPAALTAWGRYAVVTYGNDYLAAQRRRHRAGFNWLLRNAQPLITITQANVERLCRLRLPPPVVVYPGTDPAHFTPPSHAPPFPPVVLSVGRLVSRKGIDTMIQALPALLTDFPDLRYWIVGDGPDRARLEKLAVASGVQDAVVFRGSVSEASLLSLYQQAHLFILPTREEPDQASIEGFGIVYLEAAASGLPVIVGRSGGAAEAVRPGATGLLVAPDNPAEVARAVSQLLHDSALRRRMGQAGRRWVEEVMNWDRAAREIQTLLARTG